MSLAAGARLGGYEVEALIGAGGMGEVYRARDIKLGRFVAVKILPEAFAADSDRVARFQREAQLLASLNHPHIAALHGMEDTPAGHLLVMELVEGETLADRLQRGALPVEDALKIARQIAEALEAAHEKGIVHRDLKPANVKIAPDDQVKVLDFGLAKAMETSPAAAADLTRSPTLSMMATQAGMVLGTAAYMSPEQAKGVPADQRSDIFSFGSVLFEMLTGRQPFHGDTAPDILASVLVREPDLKALPPNLNPRLGELLRRCLEKSPKKRWQAIGDVRAEIETIAAAPHSTPPLAQAFAPPQPLWRRAIPFALTAIAVGGIAGTVGYYSRLAPAAPVVTRFSFSLGDGQQFTNQGRQMLAISPDSTQMVYVANRRLWLRSMADPNARPIPGTDITQGVVNPVFSPDGRSLAFWSAADQTLKRIAVGGGAPVTICPASNPYGMSWDPDGIVFGQGPGGIMRVSSNGGKPEQLIGVKNGELAHGPQVLPGGQLLLFTVATGTNSDRWDKAQVVVQSLTSGERKTLIENGSDARYLPTGHIVYALGGVLYAVPFDLGRLQITAGPVPILEGIRRGNNVAVQTGVAHFSVANGGSLIFIPGPVSTGTDQSGLALFDAKGGTETLKLPPGSYTTPRVSPAGRYIAFGNNDGKEVSIWIYELSGASSMRRLTFGGNNQYPIWSPDGQRVAFNSDREGDRAIFWQKADGTDAAERLTRAEQGIIHAPKSWSPDGKQFLFEATTGSSVSLWMFSFQDRKSTLIAGVESTGPLDPTFSPDGRWIAYQSGQTVVPQVYVQPFPSTGAKYQITKNGGFRPVWSPDGKQLFFSPMGGGLFAVVTIATQPSFTVGNPEPLQRGWAETFGFRNFDILPDGKRFIAVAPAGETPPGAPAAPQINVVLNWFEELKQRVPIK